MSSRTVRLLVCDDSVELRTLLRETLAAHPRIEIVGEADDGAEAVELAGKLEPDVVLMDVELPVLDGVEATRRLHALLPAARIVAFAGSDDTTTVMAMMAAGASAYCAKSAGIWELERTIVGQADPLVRLAQGLARAAPGFAKSELVARELRHSTGAVQTAVYGSPDGLANAPALARRAFAQSTPARERGKVAVPLIADGETLGAVYAALPLDEDRELDVELVCAIADLAASAFATDRRVAESIAEARRDALTGLGNRRAFDERLEVAVRDAVDGGRPVGVVLLDLDDFKHVNDTRGHVAGDLVLRQTAVVLMREARAHEEVFRFGGEEFAVVVEGDSAAAARLAERMRAALVRQRRGEPLPTLSAGVASAPEDARTVEGVLVAADAALYAAKWAGKNRVLAFGRESAEPRAVARDGKTRSRILVVDDDANLRTLLRTTFEVVDLEIHEAEDARAAAASIERVRPDVVVLDVQMPGVSGVEFCRALKADPETSGISVVLLTGSLSEDEARDAGAEAFLRKPFSPLELLATVERLAGGADERALRAIPSRPRDEQLLLYADDLRRLLELEKGQRALLQRSYRDTVTALATALESKDAGTGAHSERVQRYALELAGAVDAGLLDDQSLEYGFLLHDVGKIGIPDSILLKPGALSAAELRLMRTHTLLGEQMLGEVALLRGEGIRVVRSHHERWDGGGYPDGLAGRRIPLGARIFAVADTLDAMTSERPYRGALPWGDALDEIVRNSGSQFDPTVVEALQSIDPRLRRIAYEFATA